MIIKDAKAWDRLRGRLNQFVQQANGVSVTIRKRNGQKFPAFRLSDEVWILQLTMSGQTRVLVQRVFQQV